MDNKQDTIIIEYKIKTYQTLPSDKRDKKSKFTVFVDGELIGLVNSPAYDGARLLLKLGYDPDRLMTTQSLYSKYHSWEPKPIREWANITVTESKNGDIRTRPYIAFPNML